MPYHDNVSMPKNLAPPAKKKKKSQEQIFEKKKKVCNCDRFKEHSKHHSKKHINEMKKLIKKGKSFDMAHKEVMKKFGK